MPNIHQYDAPKMGGVSQLRPNEGGATALEQAARSSGRFASQRESDLASVGSGQVRAAQAHAASLRDIAEGVKDLGNVVGQAVAEHQERQEFSQFYAGASEVENNTVRAWAATRAQSDPNDPGVIKKFNEEVLGPTLEKFAGNFQTKAGQQRAEEWAGRFTSHMLTVQMADQSAAASIAFKQNVDTFKNTSADTLMFDPTSYAHVQEQARTMFRDFSSNPNITEEVRAALKAEERVVLRDNARAAFVGMARANPDAAITELDAGKFKDVLDEGDIRGLQSYAQMEKNLHRENEERARVEADRVAHDAAYAQADKIAASTIGDDGQLHVPADYYQNIRDLAKMPKVPPGLITSAINYGRALTQDAITGRLVTTDSHTYQDLWERAQLDISDPKRLTSADLMDARSNQLLSNADYTRLNQFLTKERNDPARKAAEKQFTEFLNGMKSSITKSNVMIGMSFPEQDQRFYQYKRDMRERFDQAYASGNWSGLLDPRNGDYLGKLAPPYMTSTKEGMKMLQDSINKDMGIAPPVAEQPGQKAAPKPTKPLNEFMGTP